MEIPAHMYGNAMDVLACELDAAIFRANWAVVLGLRPFRDGDSWCVLMGDDLQEGVAAFGESPHDAMMNFDQEFRSKVKE